MTRLSNRQYPMLQAFILDASHYMSVKEAQSFDQRPFRSMLVQEWIRYVPGKGFHITPEGRRAWYEFQNTDIARKDPTLPLTAYFDPEIYGLKLKRMPKRKHADKNGATEAA
jgi:hypothetical protein